MRMQIADSGVDDADADHADVGDDDEDGGGGGWPPVKLWESS